MDTSGFAIAVNALIPDVLGFGCNYVRASRRLDIIGRTGYEGGLGLRFPL